MADEVRQVVELILENWEQIGVVEGDGGVLYMPASIKRRNAKGGVSEERVYLRNLDNPQRVKCRVQARAWAAELKLDPEKDGDLTRELENYEILAYAIRVPDASFDPEAPATEEPALGGPAKPRKKPFFSQHVESGKTLWKLYDMQSLGEIWGVYDAWVRMLHPSFGTWDGEKLWRTIAAVKAGSTIAPLAVLPGIEQASCLLFMAREACLSPNRPSWLASSGTSTRAR